MTSEINNFIKNIQVFEAAKNGVEMLNFAASHNQSKNLAQFEEMLKLSNEAQKILFEIIINQLENAAQKSEIPPEKITQNLAKIIAIIKNISAEIPHSSELIDMFESCNKSFTPAKINHVFADIKKSPEKFLEQILFLDELCREH